MLWSRRYIHRGGVSWDIPTERSRFLEATRDPGRGFFWYEAVYRDIWRADRIFESLSLSLELPRCPESRLPPSSIYGSSEIRETLDPCRESLYTKLSIINYQLSITVSSISHFSESLGIPRIYYLRDGTKDFSSYSRLWWRTLWPTSFWYIRSRGGREDRVSEEELLKIYTISFSPVSWWYAFVRNCFIIGSSSSSRHHLSQISCISLSIVLTWDEEHRETILFRWEKVWV